MVDGQYVQLNATEENSSSLAIAFDGQGKISAFDNAHHYHFFSCNRKVPSTVSTWARSQLCGYSWL